MTDGRGDVFNDPAFGGDGTSAVAVEKIEFEKRHHPGRCVSTTRYLCSRPRPTLSERVGHVLVTPCMLIVLCERHLTRVSA